MKRQEYTSNVPILSLVMILVFASGQAIGLILRLTFKAIYTSDQYGVFAFAANSFALFVTIATFSLHVPIIAAISSKPDDTEYYKRIRNDLFSSSLILSILVAVGFVVWMSIMNVDLNVALLFAVFVVVRTISSILHAFPRGLDRMRPVAESTLLTGATRLVLLLVLLLGFVLELHPSS